MIHVDVKKLRRIPEGGGWRADPTQSPANHRSPDNLGFDYVHVAVDDHSRFAYAEVLPDKRLHLRRLPYEGGSSHGEERGARAAGDDR